MSYRFKTSGIGIGACKGLRVPSRRINGGIMREGISLLFEHIRVGVEACKRLVEFHAQEDHLHVVEPGMT